MPGNGAERGQPKLCFRRKLLILACHHMTRMALRADSLGKMMPFKGRTPYLIGTKNPYVVIRRADGSTTAARSNLKRTDSKALNSRGEIDYSKIKECVLKKSSIS